MYLVLFTRMPDESYRRHSVLIGGEKLYYYDMINAVIVCRTRKREAKFGVSAMSFCLT